MSLARALSVSIIVFVLGVRSAQNHSSTPHRCYYPDAIPQPLDTPCHPLAAASVCCALEDVCLSNGLCWRANINRLHRGSCTDPTFQDPACSQICTGPNDHPFGWADVLECPLSTEWYCGWGNQSRCETGETFEISDGYFDDPRKSKHKPKTVTATVTEACLATALSSTEIKASKENGQESNQSAAASARPSASTTMIVFKNAAPKSGVDCKAALLSLATLITIIA